MLDRCLPRDSLNILDVGCGAGNMIHHLSRYGTVQGVDNNPAPLKVARRRGYRVELADAQALPFPEGSFDLVAALDLVEHCPDDRAVLAQCHRVCAPGGHIVVTVPAYQWLWTENDVLNHHYRRYTAGRLREALAGAGFRVLRMTYNNTLVFPLAGALLLARRGGGKGPELSTPDTDQDAYQVEMEPASPPVNAVLTVVGWLEAQLLHWMDLPFGTSIICIGRKDEAQRAFK